MSVSFRLNKVPSGYLEIVTVLSTTPKCLKLRINEIENTGNPIYCTIKDNKRFAEQESINIPGIDNLDIQMEVEYDYVTFFCRVHAVEINIGEKEPLIVSFSELKELCAMSEAKQVGIESLVDDLAFVPKVISALMEIIEGNN